MKRLRLVLLTGCYLFIIHPIFADSNHYATASLLSPSLSVFDMGANGGKMKGNHSTNASPKFECRPPPFIPTKRVNLDENFEFNCPQWAKLGAASPGDADRRWKWDDEHASQERPSLRKPNARARVPKPLLSTADIEDARRIRIARESNTAPSSPPKRPMPQSCEPLVCDVEPWWKSLETEDPDVTSVLRS